MRKTIIAVIILSFLFSAAAACGAEERFDINKISNYTEIPGVTEQDSSEIEALINSRDYISYGQLLETESFILPGGEYAGFAAMLCEWLTELFGIEFRHGIYPDIHSLTAGIDSAAVGLTIDLSAASCQDGKYFTSQPIMYRELRIYACEELNNYKAVADVNGSRIGFLNGTLTAASIAECYPELTFSTVEFDSIDAAAEGLLAGDIDIFVVEGVMDPFFEQYDIIRSKPFFPMVYTPVSIVTADPGLTPVITVIDKYLSAGGIDIIFEMHAQGELEYSKYKLYKSLSADEQAYLSSLKANNETVKIAVESDNYPASFYNSSDKSFQGIAIEILSEISRLTDIEFESLTTRQSTWSEIIGMLDSGEASMVTHLLYTEERAARYIWSDPYDSTDCILISRSDYPYLEPYQLPMRTLGIISGTGYYDMYIDWFNGSGTIIGFGTNNEALDALEKGIIDVFMSHEYTLLYQLHYREKTDFKANMRFTEPLDSKFGFNRDEVVLRSIINKTLKYVDTELISAEWKSRSFDYTYRMAQVRAQSLAGLAVMLMLALVMAAVFFRKNRQINRSLEVTVRKRTQELESQAVILSDAMDELADYNDMLMILQGSANIGAALETAAAKLRQMVSCDRVMIIQKVADTDYSLLAACPQSDGSLPRGINEIIEHAAPSMLNRLDGIDDVNTSAIYVLGLSSAERYVVLGFNDQDRYLTDRESKLLTKSSALLESLSDKLMSQSAVEQILHSVDALIYVTELDTGKILFVNKKMKETYNITDERGNACWDVFQHDQHQRCDFCPVPSLTDENSPSIVWEEHSKVTGQYYQNTDKLIRWIDGRLVHIQHSVDITTLKEAEEGLQEAMAALAVYNGLLKILQSELDTDDAIYTAASTLKQMCNCDRIVVMKEVNGKVGQFEVITSDPVIESGDWLIDSRAGDYVIPFEFIRLPDHIVPDDFFGVETVYVLGMSGKGGYLVLEFSDQNKDIPSENQSLLLDSLSLFESLLMRKEIESERADFADTLERKVEERTEELRQMTHYAEEARDNLARQTATLTTIYAAIPDMLFSLDTEMRYTSSNFSFEQLTGYPEEEILGKGNEFVFARDPEMCRLFTEENLEVLETRQVSKSEKMVTYPDNSHRVLETIKTPLYHNGKLTGLMGIARDITERKAMEEAAYEASRAKTLFLANMSHEIRTPMNAIIGMTELLLNERLDGRKLQYVNDIHSSAKSLLSIINDILDLSKIDEGKLSLIPIDVDLKLLLSNVISMISFTALAKGLSVIDDIQLGDTCYVLIDETRIKQVLLNLLSNGVKFTNSGHVKLAAKIENGSIILEVSDTGIGIKEGDKELVFAAFEQSDIVRNRSIKGTGLGLSITKRLVEMMEGTISLESEYGSGSVFRVTLPYKQGQKPAEVQNIVDSGYLKAPLAQVMLVDDIQTNLTVGAGLLRLHGIAADLALSGKRAMEMLREKDYDIVFMDHMMPEEDGVVVTKKIRALGGKYEKLPIIALTANALNEARELLLGSGMNDFLSKPIDQAELKDKLMKWLPPEKLELNSPDTITAVREEYSEILKNAAQIDCLNIELALSRLGGLQDVLEEAVRQTAISIEPRISRMDTCLSNSDLERFAIDAHGFKSSLANIGALEYSSLAAELEVSAGAGDLRQCIDKFTLFSSVLEGLAIDLKKLVLDLTEQSKPQGDRALLMEKAAELIDNLNEFEADDAIACLQELIQFTYDSEIDSQLQEVKNAIDTYEYDEAVKLLTALSG